MSVLISHPTGNANVRAVLRSLRHAGLLSRFHTTLAAPTGDWPNRLGQLQVAKLDQRRFPEVDWGDICLHPTRELVRQLAKRFGPKHLIRHETGWASVDAVYGALDRAVALDLRRNAAKLRAVYAYEDGALETFREAKKHDVRRIYDLPIAHWQTLKQLLIEESDLMPAWAHTTMGLYDSAAKCHQKDEELDLADRIVVPSEFVRDSLPKGLATSGRVSVQPFGCPAIFIEQPTPRLRGTPLKLIFAGHVSQRKGFAYIIRALKNLQVDWTLTIAGSLPNEPPEDLVQFLEDPRCLWVGLVPHRDLLRKMAQHHVFVFPSIVEGMALVTTEALACGLPVITTANAGCMHLKDGWNGFCVPIRDPDTLAQRITTFDQDEDLRRTMATNALLTAKNSSWKFYETAMHKVISAVLT